MKYFFILFTSVLFVACNTSNKKQKTQSNDIVDVILNSKARIDTFKNNIEGNWIGYYQTLSYQVDTIHSNKENSEEELFANSNSEKTSIKVTIDTINSPIRFDFDTTSNSVNLITSIVTKDFNYSTNHGIIEYPEVLSLSLTSISNELEKSKEENGLVSLVEGYSYEIRNDSLLNNLFLFDISYVDDDSLCLIGSSSQLQIVLTKIK